MRYLLLAVLCWLPRTALAGSCQYTTCYGRQALAQGYDITNSATVAQCSELNDAATLSANGLTYACPHQAARAALSSSHHDLMVLLYDPFTQKALSSSQNSYLVDWSENTAVPASNSGNSKHGMCT